MLRIAIATQTRPWNHPSSKIDLSLLEQVKAGNTPSKIQTCFYEIISNKYFNHKHTYTDDSMFDGKVGHGVVNNSTNISSSLPPTCSIFCAEDYALTMSYIPNLSQNNRPTVVFSDFVSCLREMSSSSLKHP